MANAKILEAKQKVIDEIKSHVEESNSIVLFDYRGITDSEAKELRVKLKEANSDYKVYKNTLMSRAFDDLKIDVKDSLTGPSAFAFSNDQVAAVKILSDFAKEHPALVLKVGIVDGEISDKDMLAKLAKLPSKDTLLTQLAGALIAIPKDLAICLDLYSQDLEK